MSRPTERMWSRMEPVYARIVAHPFVTGLTDGTLPDEAFRTYVIQDGLYLRDYARALALCAARATDTPTLRMFCMHAAEAVDAERELHARLMGDLGIDAGAAAAATPSPTCRAYTSFLLAACTMGERHEALAAVLPCFWIYREVGRLLVDRGSPDPRHRAWIATYAGDEFGDAAQGAIDACDAVLGGLPEGALADAGDHALTAARYEWMFWDAAWRGEDWPV